MPSVFASVMPTFTAITTVRDKPSAIALGEALEQIDQRPVGLGILELEDGTNVWEVAAYFDEPPDEIVVYLLGASFGSKPFVFSTVPEKDWVAHVQRELSPVEVGRFYVYGGHDRNNVPVESIGLLIEASMAFGTGHHGTTKGCLLALNDMIDEGCAPSRVIDLGCGTAVLAMAVSAFWDIKTIASDIDAVAIEVAEVNVGANRLKKKVLCLKANGFEHSEIISASPFDLIVANILKGPLIEMALGMAKNSAPGGTVILSGLLDVQFDEVFNAYKNQGFILKKRNSIGEWLTMRLEKKLKL
jgi:ribosomal protein L11 methyltransferase